VTMLHSIRVYIVRFLTFIAPAADHGVEPGSLWDGTLAKPTQIALLGDALMDGNAMVTATAQLPRHVKRDGNSLVGYIANGTSCKQPGSLILRVFVSPNRLKRDSAILPHGHIYKLQCIWRLLCCCNLYGLLY
jgi:hypothetical protein